MPRKSLYWKLQKRVENMCNAGHDVSLDSNAQGYQIRNKTGDRILSGRFTKMAEINIWIDGYLSK
jgi:hypothetical protein